MRASSQSWRQFYPSRLFVQNLVAITLGTESRTPLRDLLDRLESELVDLRHSGVLKDLEIDFEAVTKTPRLVARPLPKKGSFSSSQQTELHFSD
ncbi:hypothetical protein ALO91_200017 [Pseudomonas syringae pv. aceris]|uniref:Conjugal transfer protein n=1 Tax=Pseudomonas syringae pv. aceris TaxID=199198 RepID=A0A0P9HBK0_PSESX|nr:hypothetical protein ALO91_200017 [Pseudomonas syringae pv. aceris]